MPEELAILLVLLCLALVVLYAVGRALATTIRAIGRALKGRLKTRRDAKVRTKRERFETARKAVAGATETNIPNEIHKKELLYESIQKDFRRFQEESHWIAAAPTWERIEFKPYQSPSQRPATRGLKISDLPLIALPNKQSWSEHEQQQLELDCRYPGAFTPVIRPAFRNFAAAPMTLERAVFSAKHNTVDAATIEHLFKEERDLVERYNAECDALMSKYEALRQSVDSWKLDALSRWSHFQEQCDALESRERMLFEAARDCFTSKCRAHRAEVASTLAGFRERKTETVHKRVSQILSSITFPASLPRFWNINYDGTERVLIVEIALPDVVHKVPTKDAAPRSSAISRPLNKAERKSLVPRFHPSIMLRVAYEILRNDSSDTIKLLVINGWVDYIDPQTGRDARAYTATVLLTPEQMSAIDVQRLDPVAAFSALKGRSAGSFMDIVPIEPALNLNTTDPRFVDSKAILDSLSSTTNLAAMDWQEFEHLIRELFEKVFSNRGAAVKITQASRDRGVDAVAFDPDPIQGGKYIIQAKRYTNTVDVSAVRDLCAVVRKEGASRGILVTTSTFGADAYQFANNEPITLLNGGQLLGLLGKHGYNFRIDIAEARRLRIN